MTDMVETNANVGESQVNETQQVETPVQVEQAEQVQQVQQEPESAQESQAKKAERLFTRDEVAKISNTVKNETYEKARREALEELKRDQELSRTQQQQSQSSQVSSNEEQTRRMINEEVERRAQRLEAEKIVSEFSQKLTAGKEKYSDFNETIGLLNLPQNTHLVQWANGLDNTADVLYEIAKHPSKFANLQMLAATAPHMAVQEMMSLSKSIKQNEDAVKQKSPSQPLSQVKPSNTGTDNGSMTVRDYKKASWLKV